MISIITHAQTLLAFLRHHNTRVSYIKVSGVSWSANILIELWRAEMSSSSRSASPYLANSSDTSRSTPDKDESASEIDEGLEEFTRKVAAASPTSTINTPPKACEQDDAIIAASLR